MALVKMPSCCIVFLLLFSFCNLHAQSKTDTASASTFRDKATQLTNSGHYDSALHYARKAHTLYKATQQWKAAVNCLVDVAVNHLYKSEYSLVKTNLEDALNMISQHTPEAYTLYGDTYNILGVMYYEKGDYENAVDNLKRSLEYNLLSGNVDSLDIAVNYNNLGAILSRKGDYDEAILYYNKSLDIHLKQHAPPLRIAENYNNLNVSYYRKKNFAESLNYSRRYLEILDQQKGQDLTKRYIACYNSLAIACFELKRYADALDYLNKALQLNQSTSYMVEKTYHNMGYVYRMLGKDDQAKHYLALALERNKVKYGEKHPDIGKEYRHLGAIHARKNENIQALRFYQKALTILVPDFNDSSVFINPVMTGVIKSKPDLLRTLHDKGNALLRHATLAEAIHTKMRYYAASFETFRRAIDLIDLMRSEYELEDSRQFITEEALPVYEDAIESATWLLGKTGNSHYTEVIFEMLEKSRALLLLEEIQFNKSRYTLSVPDSLLQKEKRLNQNILFYEKQLADAITRKDSALTALNRNYLIRNQSTQRQLTELFKIQYPLYYSKKNVTIATLKDVQLKVTDHETAFIEYFVGRKKIYTISITAGKVRFFEREKPVLFDQWVSQYRNSIADYSDVFDSAQTSFTRYTHHAYALYDLLLSDILKRLPEEVTRLILVPDGVLGHIPFEALLTSPVENPSGYAALPYLIRQYAITYSYSGSLQHVLKSKEAIPDNTCIAFAPGFSSSESFPHSGALSALRSDDAFIPGTQYEVRDIANLFDGKFYFNDAALERRFKEEAGSYGIIHLATHGVADPDFPLRSNLKFASVAGDSEDNVLYAYEISSLPLQANLVVLSACETGYGKILEGEGPMSIGRSFIYAGSRSVLTSLWKVEDKASAQLIAAFYNYLAAGKSKDDALRQARLDYLSKADNFKAHPIFWSGFVLIGENAAIPARKPVWVYGALALLMVMGGYIAFSTRRSRIQAIAKASSRENHSVLEENWKGPGRR